MSRTASVAAQPAEPLPPPTPAGRKAWLIPAAVMFVAAAAIGGWMALRPPAPAPPAPPPEKVLVKVISEPPGAQIAINGVDTGRITPAEVEVDPASASLPSVTLSSRAHKPVTAQLTSDDVKKGRLQLRLEAVPQPEVRKIEKPAVPVPETRTEVTITGDYPFEVLDAGGRVISAMSQSHHIPVTGRPRLRLHNPDYFLDQAVQPDGEKTFEWAAPGLGKLQVSGRETCTVAIGGRNLGELPMTLTIAAGNYLAEVACGGPARRQPFSVYANETNKLTVK
jgi:hypothetical protein